jgi:hypothetical protein
MKSKIKNTIVAGILALTLGVAGCESSNQYGECVGIQDMKQESSKLEYHVPARNIILTVIFSGSLIAPAFFFFADFECPIGPK